MQYINKDFYKNAKGELYLYWKFKQLIDEKGITPYRVAKDTGLSPMVFSDWKLGKSKPKADKLLIIANYLDVPVECLIECDTPEDVR